MRILPAKSRVANATTVVVRDAVQAAVCVRRKAIGIAVRAVMIAISVAAGVLRDRADGTESRVGSEGLAASARIADSASSDRLSRRHRAFPW